MAASGAMATAKATMRTEHMASNKRAGKARSSRAKRRLQGSVVEQRKEAVHRGRLLLMDLLYYLAFLVVFTFVIVQQKSSDGMYNYFLKSLVREAFLGNEFGEHHKTFEGVLELHDVWDYMETVMLDQLSRESWYNGQPLEGAYESSVLFNNRLLGGARIRQLRVRPDSCRTVPAFDNIQSRCFGKWLAEDEEKRDWFTYQDAITGEQTVLQWASQDDLLEPPWWGNFWERYPGSGFTAQLASNRTLALATLQELKRNLFIDSYTRVVFVDFTTYSSTLNLFLSAKLAFEQLPTGGVVPTAEFRTFALSTVASAAPQQGELTSFVLEVIFWLFVFDFTRRELGEMVILGWLYWRASEYECPYGCRQTIQHTSAFTGTDCCTKCQSSVDERDVPSTKKSMRAEGLEAFTCKPCQLQFHLNKPLATVASHGHLPAKKHCALCWQRHKACSRCAHDSSRERTACLSAACGAVVHMPLVVRVIAGEPSRTRCCPSCRTAFSSVSQLRELDERAECDCDISACPDCSQLHCPEAHTARRSVWCGLSAWWKRYSFLAADDAHAESSRRALELKDLNRDVQGDDVWRCSNCSREFVGVLQYHKGRCPALQDKSRQGRSWQEVLVDRFGEQAYVVMPPRKSWSRTVWNYIDLVNISIFLYVIYSSVRLKLDGPVLLGCDTLNSCDWDQPGTYASFAHIAATAWYSKNLNALNAVLSFLKVFKYLNQIPATAVLSRTLGKAALKVALFLLLMFVVIFGYSLAFNIAMGGDLAQFRSIEFSIVTLVRYLVGDFDFDVVFVENRVVGSMLFFSYLIMGLFIMLNMFISIISEAYEEATEEGKAGKLNPIMEYIEAVSRRLQSSIIRSISDDGKSLPEGDRDALSPGASLLLQAMEEAEVLDSVAESLSRSRDDLEDDAERVERDRARVAEMIGKVRPTLRTEEVAIVDELMLGDVAEDDGKGDDGTDSRLFESTSVVVVDGEDAGSDDDDFKPRGAAIAPAGAARPLRARTSGAKSTVGSSVRASLKSLLLSDSATEVIRLGSGERPHAAEAVEALEATARSSRSLWSSFNQYWKVSQMAGSRIERRRSSMSALIEEGGEDKVDASRLASSTDVSSHGSSAAGDDSMDEHAAAAAATAAAAAAAAPAATTMDAAAAASSSSSSSSAITSSGGPLGSARKDVPAEERKTDVSYHDMERELEKVRRSSLRTPWRARQRRVERQLKEVGLTKADHAELANALMQLNRDNAQMLCDAWLTKVGELHRDGHLLSSVADSLRVSMFTILAELFSGSS